LSNPRGAPALDHLAVTPVLDVARGVAGDRNHRLDGVRDRQGAREPVRHTQSADGEHLLEAFAQRRGSRAVPRTKRRDTADFDVDLAASSTVCPTGSAAARCRRVASPASMRSNTTCSS
jgi:hypothetical protein